MKALIMILCAAAVACAPTWAAAISWQGPLSGSQSVPPNGSTATGFAVVSLLGDTLSVDVNWSGLTGGVPAAAHIHCCIPFGSNVGVAVGFPGFPATLSGSYMHSFDLTDAAVYTNSFLTTFGGGTASGAEAALINGLNTNQAYVNIHNREFPGGEIRADVVRTPEPATFALGALGIGCLALLRRKRALG